MKNNIGRHFYTQVLVHMLYSAIIACLIEVFVITNIDLIVTYLIQTESSLASFASIFRMGTITTVLYVVFGIGVFSATFFFLQRRTLKYIGKIAVAVQNMAEGDLNTQIEVWGDDEFSMMAENLNRMSEELKSLIDREREAERSKNELITNVAHDLRTPLTSIIGYLELLSRGVPLPQEMQQKYIEIAYTKTKRLEKLIEDLFGFTKMNYGKIAMHVGSVDIVKLLGQLLEEFYPSFAEKELTYELTSNVPAKVITADGNLLARLFDNLINNAIKYGAEGKRVLVQVTAEEEWVTISVTNFGYVIPKEELPLLFNKFYRVEHSRSVATGGTGLGLAIAKSIVDMHGGTIDAASDLNGTVFTVRLQVNFDINKENFR